jgi:hypothetical protein
MPFTDKERGEHLVRYANTLSARLPQDKYIDKTVIAIYRARFREEGKRLIEEYAREEAKPIEEETLVDLYASKPEKFARLLDDISDIDDEDSDHLETVFTIYDDFNEE